MDRGSGDPSAPKTMMVLRTYEDCQKAIESVLPAATGDVSQVLAQLRDFMKSRIERSETKKAEPRGDDDFKPDVSAIRKRINPTRVAAPIPFPKTDEVDGAQFEKGALE